MTEQPMAKRLGTAHNHFAVLLGHLRRLAKRLGFVARLLIGGLDRTLVDAKQGTDRHEPHHEADNPQLAPGCLLNVEQHDHEQEQHHHRPGVNEDLHRREEVGIEQHEQPGNRDHRGNEKHRARHRVAAQRVHHHQQRT